MSEYYQTESERFYRVNATSVDEAKELAIDLACNDSFSANSIQSFDPDDEDTYPSLPTEVDVEDTHKGEMMGYEMIVKRVGFAREGGNEYESEYYITSMNIGIPFFNPDAESEKERLMIKVDTTVDWAIDGRVGFDRESIVDAIKSVCIVQKDDEKKVFHYVDNALNLDEGVPIFRVGDRCKVWFFLSGNKAGYNYVGFYMPIICINHENKSVVKNVGLSNQWKDLMDVTESKVVKSLLESTLKISKKSRSAKI